MKVGDLVKCKRLNKIGIIMGYAKTHRCVGTMYGVFLDGMMIAQHESYLEAVKKCP